MAGKTEVSTVICNNGSALKEDHIMASCGGRFEQFIEDGNEDFESDVERLEHYFQSMKVSDDLKVLLFVTAIGKQAYRTLRTLLTPVKLEQKDYAHLVMDLREEHYAPKSMMIAERFKFNQRAQLQKETVATFTVEVKRLAATCDFWQFLDEALWDRFVAGLNDQTAQAELLKKKTNFLGGVRQCQKHELARAETKKFQLAAPEQVEVNAVQRLVRDRNVGASTRKATMAVTMETSEASCCFRCGAPHAESICPFGKYKCRVCRRVGHLARVSKSTSRLVHAVEEGSGEDNAWLYNTGSCNASKGGYTTEVRGRAEG
ncbi:uncharacterized protein LOC121838450 [Ixodes scapularis]|uniref:uncharacterized protein LOC121838450 n=1 Tax=Ixodes scapularis TaxID=6945 RepID=UPI001C38A50C|nr:uncharacterized protein LOC121838450 [Ixodes scapularis]